MLFFARWKIAVILAVIVAGLAAVLPSFLPAATVAGWPSFLPKRQIALGLDLQGGAYLLYAVDREGHDQAQLTALVEQSIAAIRRRVDELGIVDAIVERKGADRILVEAPGLRDPERLKSILDQTARLSFHRIDATASVPDAVQGNPPPGTIVLYSFDDPPEPFVVGEAALLTGADLADVQVVADTAADEASVTFRLSSDGVGKLASGAGADASIAVVLDDEVIAAGPFGDMITGDAGRLSGRYSIEGAEDLAVLLRAGALPARLVSLEERTVGPGLGADSIQAGTVAVIVAAVAVVVFMIAAYGLLGLIADLAVILNVLLILGVMSVLQATLTLPGIAGIVLTIGMAVDANVLIYERIREEARAGRSAVASIDAGFTRALATILDANITTLIAALVLLGLGSGPVQGFAVTLAIGVVTTLFTAVLVTRLMVAVWVRHARPTSVPI
jgi:protein-export membrane protein SecD